MITTYELQRKMLSKSIWLTSWLWGLLYNDDDGDDDSDHENGIERKRRQPYELFVNKSN